MSHFLFPFLLLGLLCIFLEGFFFFSVFSTILNCRNRRNVPEITDAYLAKRLPYSTFEGEGLIPAAPKWTNTHSVWYKTPPQHHLEVLKGAAQITEKERRTTQHIYTLT